jgi:hypothetical protein
MTVASRLGQQEEEEKMITRLKDRITSEELADITTLLLMFAAVAGILMALGQPIITYGSIAVGVGAASGFVKNQVDAGSIRSLLQKLRTALKGQQQTLKVVVQIPKAVTLPIPRGKIAKIDTLLPGKDISAERRAWIMKAIDEKLENTPKPKFPTAA